MTLLYRIGLYAGVFGMICVGMHLGHALGEGRPTVRANAFGTALSSASPIEPASQSRPYGLQSHFAGERP